MSAVHVTNPVVIPPAVAETHRLSPAMAAVVHVLCSAAAFVALACGMLLLSGGPSEKLETRLWAAGLAIALPLGVFLGARQGRRLGETPAHVTRWALAIGISLLMLGLVLLRIFDTGNKEYAGLVVLAAAAFGVTELAIRRPALLGWLGTSSAPVIVGVSALALALALFAPEDLARPGILVPSVILAAVVFLLVRRDFRAPRLLDVGLCVLLVLVVFQAQAFPGDAYIYHYSHHQDFYLGPLNDMAHGRGMLVEVWAQYGVGLYYALLVALSVLPRNHGGLILLQSTLMAAQYVLVYATLRMAVRSRALVVAAVTVAVVANTFGQFGSYVGFPSSGPLRFGLPYLIVAAAVAAARWPQHARVLRLVQLAVVAVAAVWSFETFVYTAVTWFAVAAVASVGRGLWQFVREIAAAVGVSVLALLVLTIGTRVAYGAWPSWGGYADFIRLYSSGEFGALRIDFWSPALVFAAVIFLSAVGIVWAARDSRAGVSAPVLAGLAGFTGLAASTFTYFLGRSHPNNLLHLLVPICALGCLWASVLLLRGTSAWRVLALAFVLWLGAVLTVYSWPAVQEKWKLTALAQVLPGQGTSLGTSLADLWKGPLWDDRIDVGAKLLERHSPGSGLALVITEPLLTTEILLRADRVNLLPVSHPEEDSLIIDRLWPRVIAAIDRMPDGTILLTSVDERAVTSPILVRALEELHRRFDFQIVETTPDGLQVVRLHSPT